MSGGGLAGRDEPWCIGVLMRDTEGRTIIANELRHDGFDVVEYDDAVSLLRHLDAAERRTVARLHLVVVGACLPTGESLESLAEIRRSGWAVPVVIIDAQRTADLTGEADRLGAAAVFARIPSIDELRRAIYPLLPPVTAD